MSYWKAYAEARDARGDLFDRHVAALETLHAIAAALDDNIPRAAPFATIAVPAEEAILTAIVGLKEDLKDAQKGEEDADDERKEAERRLEEALRDKAPDERLALETACRERNEALRAERIAASELAQVRGELAVVKETVERYSAALVAMRRFVSSAEAAGVLSKPRCVPRSAP
jgi:hypothetical protein